MEKSCAVLGFYLASWGMLRGSSPLLQMSYRHYRKLIEFVDQADSENPEYLQLDVPDYADAVTRQSLLERYAQVQELLDGHDRGSRLTRTTKVMLGVWGNIPAFDRYFCATLMYDLGSRGYSRLTDRALSDVYQRFSLKAEDERFLRTAHYQVLTFSGQRSMLRYPIAKLIDMYGFIRGMALLG
jgi:hypothetical protein